MSGHADASHPPRSNAGMLLVISGPSGAGKTTIARAVEKAFDDAVFSVSATTRPRAATDRPGIDYHFLTEQEFLARVERGAFLEHAVYANNHYGTLREPVENALAEGKLAILEIDIQGTKQIKRAMPDAMAVFVLPPSEQHLLERLRARKREPEDIIQRRFAIAKGEIADAKESGIYDLFVTNDTLDRAIDETVNAVRHRRATR